MTLLAEIGLAVRGAIGGDVFPAATLHVATDATNDAGETVKAFADHPATGFVGAWKTGERPVGYPEGSAKVVLVQGPYPAPKLGDEVTAARPLTGEAHRYRVVGASSDPADATWAIGGVKV